jgi:WD40 repeat protein/serine/threonine protein kinase
MTLPSYVGRYEVVKEIARGGFAVAVLAWDEELESHVAIKILHAKLAEDEELRQRFIEEARLLRRIRSPSVVTVHDVGRLNDGRPYFVMDYADRGTLAPRLTGRSVPYHPDINGVIALVDAITDGLSAIHDAGIIHRDLKPDNILFQLARRVPIESEATPGQSVAEDAALVGTDERILVGDLGIAKDLMKRGPHVTILGGTPLYQAPEQHGPDTAITPAADIYAATALLWHVLTGQTPPETHAVRQHLASLPTAWHEVIEQGMAPAPEDRFGSMESWRSAVQEMLAQELAASESTRATVAVALTVTCPYKGLAAYQPEDARFFFGRESLIDELVRRMQLHNILVVGGSSGSGKSSLVRAGLIPALHAGALPGSDKWRVALFTPGYDPMAELHFQANQASPTGNASITLDELRASPTIARRLGWSDDSQPPLVLCIDQLEELFTLASDTQRDQFAMTDPADSKVRVVCAVRADFYGACAQVPWLAKKISNNQVLVGPMSVNELRRAISEPARCAGLYLERNVIDAVIDEAGNEAGSLPLIAHALVETWMRRRGNTLTMEGYQAAGGVAGAISQTADAIYEQEFDSTQREATRRLFLRLVTPGEGTPDTRRVVARAEIDHDSHADLMHQIVERLTEARLLTLGEATVQIAHEALLRSWPRLRGWIEERRDDLRTRQRINRAAAEWDAEGRTLDLLYRGTHLSSALEWAEKNHDQLSPLGQDFLTAAAQAQAEAEAIAADKERRRRKIRHLAIAALSILAVGTSAASVLAFLESRDAQRSEKLAKQANAEAKVQFAGALGAVAHGLVETDPLLALSLAAEGVMRSNGTPPVYDTRAAMIDARQALVQRGPFLVGSPVSAGDATAITLSPNGALLAAGTRDGEIHFVDATTRMPAGPVLKAHHGGIRNLEFAPNGRQLASVGADGTIRLWTIGDKFHYTGQMLGETGDVVPGVAFSPSGSLVASANGDGTVRLWDVTTGAQDGAPLTHLPLTFKVVAFSPDGRALLAGYNDGSIYGWSLPARKPLFEPIHGKHTSNLTQLVFSPRGDRFATVSTDGVATLFEFPSGRILGPAFATGQRIGSVSFTPDGNTLIGGDASGALRLWDIDQQRLAGITTKGHGQIIVDTEFNADGTLLATLGRDLSIRFWSFTDGHPFAVVQRIEGRAKGIAFSTDGNHLAIGDDAGAVHIWDVATDAAPLVLAGHQQQVWAVAFSADGKWLASGDRAGEVRLWDLAHGTLKWTATTQDGAVWSLTFATDGQRLLSASDARLRFWDISSGTSQQVLERQGVNVTRAALSPDGALAAVASTSGKVTIWDIAHAAVIKEITADDNALWSVAFSPNGEQLATASSDEVVALWDVHTGEQRASFAGLTGGATDVAFLADGVTLIAVDRSGQLHWWDAQTGRPLADAWQAHAGASWRIAVDAGGQRFASAGDDGMIKIWDELSVNKACRIGAVALDSLRRRQYLGEGGHFLACGRNL